MNTFTNAEMADSHFICGLANGNAEKVQRIYRAATHVHIRQHLNITYPNCWIESEGPQNWPVRNSDMSPLDFYSVF